MQPTHVTIAPNEQDGWLVTINGVTVKAYDYEAGPDEETGAPLLRLIIAVDSLSIGDPVKARKDAEEKTAVRVWGSPVRDPREGIAGWRPRTVAEQVAANAEARA